MSSSLLQVRAATDSLAVGPAPAVGIGLRHPHAEELLARRPPLGFVEVHSENFFADGGATHAVLRQVCEAYPLSLHGVGLSLGSAAGLDPWHLAQLERLVERTEPLRVSDHASFARAATEPGGPVRHANDLLPIAFTRASLDILSANVAQVQDRLRRPILVENLSAYLAWGADEMSEPEFFNALTRRTGCGLLLDVNNLVVNALNAQPRAAATDTATDTATKAATEAACRWVDQLTPGSVGEIHLAGYHDCGDIVIDDHGSRVHAPVWQAYEHAVRRLGAVPTLIEWDTDLPALDVLLDEARTAESLISAAVPAPSR